MKLKNILTGVLALTTAATAMADVTVDITGATAFRVATLDSIKAQFIASGQPWKLVHDRNEANSQSFNGATRSIFQGTFPGVTGTTTIRTSFNGSVEGINALVNSPAQDPTYYPIDAAFDAVTAAVGGNGGGNGLGSWSSTPVASQSEIAFSDVSITSTPFAGTPLQPASPPAGVVIFTMIANEGAPAGLTNVSNKQFQALFQQGFVPLSFFTGDPNDDPLNSVSPNAGAALLFATGRNDGSGTRTTYLAETGYGVSNLVTQYVRGATSGDTITQIHRVPAGGVSASIPGSSASNASTIWPGNDVDGNGGYSSGSALRDDMGRTSAATQVLDADGSVLLAAGDLPIHLISWLSTGDANPARDNGAKILAYNGEILSDFAAGTLNGTELTDADKDKIRQGTYTAWGYQQMYLRNDLTSGDEVTVYNGIKSNLVLGATGLTITEMNAERGSDGTVVIPQ